ncbi:MAG TPA: alpha/beta hydrolase [Candidatus Saccharimonadales bacterium]|nr:alpha/beta hydrolase [Candidatus Saccharimonadales bacterium]
MQVIVEQLLTHYDLKGEGKLVLLLHGWGDNLHSFDDLKAKLSRQYQVVVLDLPGFGNSQPPLKVWGLDDYAKFVRQFLEKLGLPQPYAIIGHSNGGALAIRALATEELKAKRLVLIAASGIRNTQRFKKLSLKIVAKTGKATTFWLPGRYRQVLRKKLYGTIGSDMLVAPNLQETFKKTVRQDVRADAAKLKLPTLLIYGDQDQAVPLQDGQIYHRLIKGSELKVVEGAGHFAHHDQPEVVAKAIEEFLK